MKRDTCRLALSSLVGLALLTLAPGSAYAHIGQSANAGSGNLNTATAGTLLTPTGFDLYPSSSSTPGFTAESVFILAPTSHGLESGIFAGLGTNITYSTCLDWYYTTDNGANEVDNKPITCLAGNALYSVHADVYQSNKATPWIQKLDGTGYTSANITLTFDYSNQKNSAQGEVLRDGDSMGYGQWNNLLWGNLNANNTLTFFSWATLSCSAYDINVTGDGGAALTGPDAYACNPLTTTSFDNLGPKQELGAAGTDSSLYASGLDPYTWNFRNWTNIPAGTTAAPAIVPNYPSRTASGEPSQPIYIVTGTDHHLYYRTDSTSWQLLSATCYDNPAAYEDTTGNLTVACRGSDNAIWFATGTVSNSAISLAGFSSLGGGSNYGPSIAPVRGQVTFFISGLDGKAWTRTPSTAWSSTGWTCSYHPAAAIAQQAGTTYFACNGANSALWYAINRGVGWSSLSSAGGTVVNGPAIAAYSQGAVVFVEGTDQQVYKTVIGPSPAVPQPWRVHSNGRVQYGVGASAL